MLKKKEYSTPTESYTAGSHSQAVQALQVSNRLDLHYHRSFFSFSIETVSLREQMRQVELCHWHHHQQAARYRSGDLSSWTMPLLL
jgi:hypothetical protein